MDELFFKIFEMCVLPLLGILTAFLVKLINSKVSEILEGIENEKGRKYLRMLQNTVCEAVIATNQTYTEYLKEAGQFDGEAQKVAFRKTYLTVLNLLNNESKVYLENLVGDLEGYITTLIEAEVNKNK